MNLSLDEMPRVKTRDGFVFGKSKFPSLGKIVIPLKYKDKDGNKIIREAECHLINHDIWILIGLEIQASWGAWLGAESSANISYIREAFKIMVKVGNLSQPR